MAEQQAHQQDTRDRTHPYTDDPEIPDEQAESKHQEQDEHRARLQDSVDVEFHCVSR